MFRDYFCGLKIIKKLYGTTFFAAISEVHWSTNCVRASVRSCVCVCARACTCVLLLQSNYLVKGILLCFFTF